MPNPTREQALNLLQKYNKEPFHILHGLTVEGVMGYFAQELGFGEETEFWKLYMPKIKAAGNIIMHGFVDIRSREFANVLAECGLLLNPSLSESGAVAVLNVLGNGALLPIYSKGTGLDIADAGIEVEEVTYEKFSKALLDAAALPTDVIKQKAWAAHNLVKERYTLDNYRETIYTHIKDIIEKRI